MGSASCSIQSRLRTRGVEMIALDTETALTRKGCQAPPLACITYATADATGILPHYTDMWVGWFAGEVTGFHIAYDAAVLCAAFPERIPLVFDAYEHDRVTCTLVRAKLLDIAFGRRKRNHGQYNLDEVAFRTLGVHLDKEDPWRLRFGELRDVPLEWWPADAKAYALKDARVTYDLWAAQEQYAHLLADQYRQTRAAFALHLMSVWGITTDPAAIDRLEYHTKQRLASMIGEVKAAGLIRPDRVLKSGPRKGLTVPGTRDEAAAQQRIVAAYANSGREFKAKDRRDPRTFPYPPTDSGAPCLDFVACTESGDPLLEKYAHVKKAQKTLGTDIPLLREGTIHPFVDTLIDTGRTSMSPNLQNLPTGRQSKLPPFVGVRECFVPRPGCVFVVCDYSGLELCTFGQICLDLFGFSRVADEINNGIDSHSIIGARIRGISYDEGIARKKANNEDFDLARQCGKVVNFGKPGGMGAQSLVFHAKNNYGVELTLSQSRELCDVWAEERPESGPYFAYINSIVNQPGLSQLPQIRSGRVRGGTSYTEACNSLFQGLGSDVAKMAGWLLAKEMYTDNRSPLWGSRMVNFVHDEWKLETPESRAVGAAKRLSEVMVEAARYWLPNVKVKAVPLITRTWCKSAVSWGDTPWEPTMVEIFSTECEEVVAKAIRAVAKGRAYELRDKAFDAATKSRSWDVISAESSMVKYGTVTVTPYGKGFRVAYE